MNLARRDVVLDTNLLVLFVVGSTNPDFIQAHKRLRSFEPADFGLLVTLLAAAKSMVVTPNTLTETSNLVGQIAQPAKNKIMARFAEIIRGAAERHVGSAVASASPSFIRLGLTDAVLLDGSFRECVLLTTDWELCGEAARLGRDAVNFNQERDARFYAR